MQKRLSITPRSFDLPFLAEQEAAFLAVQTESNLKCQTGLQ